MNPFYNLFLPLFALPVVIFAFNKWGLKNRLQPHWLMLINFAVTYLVILAGAWIIQYNQESYLNTFDLNDDGIFSGAEITPEQKDAAHELERTSARTLAPAIGFIFAFFYSAIFYCVLLVINSIKEKNKLGAE